MGVSSHGKEGVVFSSPHDGSEMVLTPEHSMGLQNIIGADIMMALDDVVSTVTEGPRIEEAMHRTIRWIDRCIAAHKRPREQNLFGILQGHLDPKLRRECITAMLSKDLPGYAIGGLSGGESKDEFWRIVDLCTDLLPTSKPRYLMGVGFAVDMIVSVALGVDMFDCVYPTRTARFGTALVRKGGTLSMKNAMNQFDMGPIEEECGCQVCTKYSRAFFYTLTKTDDQLLGQLLSQHNIAYQMRLMKDARNAIIDGSKYLTHSETHQQPLNNLYNLLSLTNTFLKQSTQCGLWSR